jgi:hypothetical protein
VCLRDLMNLLHKRFPDVTVARVRWAINSGKIPRPPLDGSLRFDFTEDHVQEIVAYFSERKEVAAKKI